MKQNAIRVLAAILLSAAAAPAFAVLTCSVSATPVGFGLYPPLSPTNVDSTGNVQVSCDGGKGKVEIRLSAGASGSAANRQMFSGGNPLDYNLFTKANRTRVWGDGTGGTDVVIVNINKAQPTTVNAPVYGRVFSNQSPAAGFYVDNIVVTVIF